MSIGLLTPSKGYKPFRYGWAYDYWQRQQRVHWMAEEVPLGEDVKDWSSKLSAPEQNLLENIFRLFTQSDIDVNDNYMETYSRIFKPTEVKMMLSAFSSMETVHINAYALLLETLGIADTAFHEFMDYAEMKDKHDYLMNVKAATEDGGRVAELANMAIFAAFGEGLQLFASFAMLMNFPRFGKMGGMGQIVSWSIRDETLHCEGILRLYQTYRDECELTWEEAQTLDNILIEACRDVVAMEDAFIDKAFEMGGVQGMTPDDIKAYIRYIANIRMKALRLPVQFPETSHPLPWLPAMISGVEHANFFERRATEYSKGASQGSWSDVWDDFDASPAAPVILDRDAA